MKHVSIMLLALALALGSSCRTTGKPETSALDDFKVQLMSGQVESCHVRRRAKGRYVELKGELVEDSRPYRLRVKTEEYLELERLIRKHCVHRSVETQY